MDDGNSLPAINLIDRNPPTKASTRRLFVKRAVASILFSSSVDALKDSRTYGATARSFPLGQLPSLDGELAVDNASRQAVADDFGRQVHRSPVAVLRPGSVADIVRIVAYANKRGLPIAMRGRGHSFYGQSQVAGGIVIDSTTL